MGRGTWRTVLLALAISRVDSVCALQPPPSGFRRRPTGLRRGSSAFSLTLRGGTGGEEPDASACAHLPLEREKQQARGRTLIADRGKAAESEELANLSTSLERRKGICAKEQMPSHSDINGARWCAPKPLARRTLECEKQAEGPSEKALDNTRAAWPAHPSANRGMEQACRSEVLALGDAAEVQQASWQAARATRRPAGIGAILENILAACSVDCNRTHDKQPADRRLAAAPDSFSVSGGPKTAGSETARAAAAGHSQMHNTQQGLGASCSKAAETQARGGARPEAIQVQEVLSLLGPSAFPVLMFILAVPCALGLPGVSTALGAVEAALALQLLAGMPCLLTSREPHHVSLPALAPRVLAGWCSCARTPPAPTRLVRQPTPSVLLLQGAGGSVRVEVGRGGR